MKLIIDDEEIKPLPIRLPMPTVDEDGDLVIGEIERSRVGERGKGLNQLEKELIAIDAQNPNLSQTEIARIHGSNQQSVSSLSRGYNTSGIDNRKVNEGVLEVVESAREKIANTATEKLLTSLETFIPQTLDQKDLPSAALKLASIVEKVNQGFQGEQGKGPRFIVFSPRVRAEDQFDIIEVRE